MNLHLSLPASIYLGKLKQLNQLNKLKQPNKLSESL
jgi:hypothetical protein